jgi:hypothetical protein
MHMHTHSTHVEEGDVASLGLPQEGVEVGSCPREKPVVAEVVVASARLAHRAFHELRVQCSIVWVVWRSRIMW